MQVGEPKLRCPAEIGRVNVIEQRQRQTQFCHPARVFVAVDAEDVPFQQFAEPGRPRGGPGFEFRVLLDNPPVALHEKCAPSRRTGPARACRPRKGRNESSSSNMKFTSGNGV